MKRETKKKLRKDLRITAQAVDVLESVVSTLIRQLPDSKGEIRGGLREKLNQIDLWEILDES